MIGRWTGQPLPSRNLCRSDRYDRCARTSMTSTRERRMRSGSHHSYCGTETSSWRPPCRGFAASTFIGAVSVHPSPRQNTDAAQRAKTNRLMPSAKPRRILVTYSKFSTFVTTTLEYLLALQKFTDYQVDYVHVTHSAWMDFNINDYDVVFQNYGARLCFDGYVSPHDQNALAGVRGLKILAVQDDYDHTAILWRAIRRRG